MLADPSGRRARMLRHIGRVLALLLMVWLIGLALAGLEVLPARRVPLGHQLLAHHVFGQRPSQLRDGDSH